jgi:DNA-binding response OmpR family regulator
MRHDVKILVVDDEKDVTDMFVRFFTFEGYLITGVNDPMQALSLFCRDNFMICILDIQMPGMSGLDLLKDIKRHNGMTGVIMMTARATTENILTALRRGAETCFLKPIDDMQAVKKAVDDLVLRFENWQRLLRDLRMAEGRRNDSGGVVS